MKAYKLEILVLDFDEIGLDQTINYVEDIKYPNHCISPDVLSSKTYDIGEWDDNHPLNKRDTNKEEYFKSCAKIK